MADYGTFAVANFVLNVLLARWLTPVDYGAFVTAYTVLLLFGTFHTAIFSEPLLVYGSSKYRGRLGSYWSLLVRSHWIVVPTLGVLVSIGAVGISWASGSGVDPAMLSLAVVTPVVLFQWMLRRACYVVLRPVLAAQAGVLYLILMIGGAYVLRHAGILGATEGLLVIAVASVGSALWIVVRLRLVDEDPDGESLFGEALRDHWRYGRWAMLTLPLGWARRDGYYLLLFALGGAASVGALRAVVNLLMPFVHAGAAVASVALPFLARAKERPGFVRTARVAAGLSLVGGLLYSGAMFAFGGAGMSWLYEGQYDGELAVLWIVALIPIPAALVRAADTLLKAKNEIRRVFFASLASVVVIPIAGVPAMAAWGTVGAAAGMALCYLVAGASMLALGAVSPYRAPSTVAAANRSSERSP